MRILFYSLWGDGGGIAYQCQREGAQVDLYIKDPFYRKQQIGLIPHVESVEEGLRNKPDFIVFDLNGEGTFADHLRKQGWKVVGGSALADKLEEDRSYGAKVAKQYGIATPEQTEFKNIESALAYVKKTKEPYALKVDNGTEASSYVAKDFEDMVGYIEQLKEEGGIKAGQTFILQEVISGEEVSTECWFADGVPIPNSINSTWETKKLHAGELGVRTGCEVSVVTHYRSNRPRLYEETVGKLLPLMKHSKWTGAIDVNAIVSEKDKKPYFLEFTPRIGYSAIYGYMAILGLPISEFLYRVSKGDSVPPCRYTWGTSLKLHVPPYPVEIENEKASQDTYEKAQGTRINGDYSNDFIPIDCQKGKRTDLEVAGTTCIVGECLGRGNDLLSAWRGSQKVFESVEVPNAGGRLTDGISDAWKRISTLRKMGYTDIPSPSAQSAGVKGGEPLSVPAPA
jgi:phosphoribosylamine--glycine ligase